MKPSRQIMFGIVLAAALPGCVAMQKVPVSTDPSGAAVYLDGTKVCEATPCSVEMKNDQTHLLTIIKDGYRQKDIQLRPAQAPGGGRTLAPDMVALRLVAPGQPDLSDTNSAVGTALELGTEMLQRVLEKARKEAAPAE